MRGTVQSIRINGVSVSTKGAVFIVKKNFLFSQNTKEIKQDISMVVLNISNLHKAIILLTMSFDTLKNLAMIFL